MTVWHDATEQEATRNWIEAKPEAKIPAPVSPIGSIIGVVCCAILVAIAVYLLR